MDVEALLLRLPLSDLHRIDAGLEGNWTITAQTIWEPRNRSYRRPSDLADSVLFPSIELMFDEFWIGLRCYVPDRGRNVFDSAHAQDVVAFVERRLGSSRADS